MMSHRAARDIYFHKTHLKEKEVELIQMISTSDDIQNSSENEADIQLKDFQKC